MKGSIQDVTVHVQPSTALLEFIKSLDGNEAIPANLIKIREEHHIKNESKEVFLEHIPKKIFTEKQVDLLKSVSGREDFSKFFSSSNKLDKILNGDDEDIEILGSKEVETNSISGEEKSNNPSNPKCKKESKIETLLNINDLRWINQMLEKRRTLEGNETYLHELLTGSIIILPENKILVRNPELEARCVKLREEQQERDYRNMTKDVDATRQHLPEDTIAYQVKSINRQLVAVFQFVVSVITGFVFGFIGLQLMFGDLDFGFRLFMGIMCALIIALAEIYFLAKKLAEYDEPVSDIPMPKPKVRPHQD